MAVRTDDSRAAASNHGGSRRVVSARRFPAVPSPIRVFHQPSTESGAAPSLGVAWFPLLRPMALDEDWQLVVRHRRGGPLGTFVAEIHRRDLAISFGVLLLLVISMTMWVI